MTWKNPGGVKKQDKVVATTLPKSSQEHISRVSYTHRKDILPIFAAEVVPVHYNSKGQLMSELQGSPLTVFQLFRLSILPLSNELSLPFYAEDKNYYLMEAIRNSQTLEHRRGVVQVTLDYDEGQHLALLTVDAMREIKIITKQHEEKNVDSYPYVHAVVDTDPNYQLLAVEVKASVFKRPRTVAKLLANSWSKYLSRYGYVVYQEPLFDKNAFWDVIQRNANHVTAIRFDLLRPNMAKISRTLPEEIREMAIAANSHLTQLKMKAPKEGNLTVSKSTPHVDELAETASVGGAGVLIQLDNAEIIRISEEAELTIRAEKLKVQGQGEHIANIVNTIANIMRNADPASHRTQ